MWRALIFIFSLFVFIYYISVVLMAFDIIEIGEKRMSWKSYLPFYQWFIKDTPPTKEGEEQE